MLLWDGLYVLVLEWKLGNWDCLTQNSLRFWITNIAGSRNLGFTHLRSMEWTLEVKLYLSGIEFWLWFRVVVLIKPIGDANGATAWWSKGKAALGLSLILEDQMIAKLNIKSSGKMLMELWWVVDWSLKMEAHNKSMDAVINLWLFTKWNQSYFRNMYCIILRKVLVYWGRKVGWNMRKV